MRVVSCQVHLFDIDVPGKITFKESEVMSPGQHLTMFDTCMSDLLSSAYWSHSLFTICVLFNPFTADPVKALHFAVLL